MNRKLTSVVFVASMALVCAAARADYAANYRSAVAALSPIASWEFEDADSNAGSTVASTNSAYNGTYADYVAQTTGFFGTGISLLGDGSVSVPNTSLPAGNSARSAILWCSTSEPATTTYHGLMGYGTPGADPLYRDFRVEAGINGDGPGKVGAGNYGEPSIHTPACNDGAWHMVAITVTPTTAGKANWTIYCDGKFSETSEMNTNTVLNASGAMLIGAEYAQGTGWIGRVDEVSMFGSALTAGSVANLYAAATGVPEPGTIMLLGTGIVGLMAYAWRKRR